VTKSRCNEAQTVGGPRDQEVVSRAAEVCRQRVIIEQTFYQWKGRSAASGCPRPRSSRRARTRTGGKKPLAAPMLDVAAL
jgi:hypothetical protein